MTKDWTPSEPTTFINGWYCPQCKKLVEHIYIYKHVQTHNTRFLQCTVCKITTPSKATTYHTEKREARLGSTLKNSGHYYGNRLSVEKDLRVTKDKIWGSPKNDSV